MWALRHPPSTPSLSHSPPHSSSATALSLPDQAASPRGRCSTRLKASPPPPRYLDQSESCWGLARPIRDKLALGDIVCPLSITLPGHLHFIPSWHVHTVVDKQDKITKLLQKFQLVQLVGWKKRFWFYSLGVQIKVWRLIFNKRLKSRPFLGHFDMCLTSVGLSIQMKWAFWRRKNSIGNYFCDWMLALLTPDSGYLHWHCRVHISKYALNTLFGRP